MCCILKIGVLVRLKDRTNVLYTKIGVLVRFKDRTNVLYT